MLPLPLMTGQTLGHYHVLDQLCAGGMGEVYRARDTKLGRDVALKVIPEALPATPSDWPVSSARRGCWPR